jgi:mandelamide amidase
MSAKADPELSSVGQVSAALAERRLSSVEYATELLRRLHETMELNAFYHLDEEQLLRDARKSDERRAAGKVGRLEGIPVAIKDNISVANAPNTAGTPALRSHRPKTNAPIAQALVEAGALLMGKTAMDELAFGSTCNNAAFGATHNPLDPERIPGGSSGGSGAVVAAGVAPLALGTDTGGSVRVPAALCGIFGFRPTVGRYSTKGIVPISRTRDTAGPLARSVADLALVDSVIGGGESTLEAIDPATIRLGVPWAYFRSVLDAGVQAAFEAAMARLRRANVTLVEADVPRVEDLNTAAGFPITLHETPIEISKYLDSQGIGMSFEELVENVATPNVKRILTGLTGERRVPDAQYERALKTDRVALQDTFAGYLESNRLDAIAIPTVPLPAARIADGDEVNIGGVSYPTFEIFIRNTSPGSVAGTPGISMPIGRTREGLAVGLGLEGGQYADRRLLAVAAALEPVIADRS